MSKSFENLIIEESNLKESVLKIALSVRPSWSNFSADEFSVRDLCGGISNRLLCCYVKETGMDTTDTVLLRIYGKNTELFISRSEEISTMKLMKTVSLGPEFYCQFKNGICYEYLPGNITDQKLIFNENVYTKIAQAIATLHLANFEGLVTEAELVGKQQPFIFNKIRDLLHLVKPNYRANMKHMTDEFMKTIPSVDKIDAEFSFLETHLREYTNLHKSLIVFSHNDLLLGNIIWNEKTKCIKFIDYEYGALNFQAYDIANHFNEYSGVDEPDYSYFPNKEYQLRWLRIYLESFYGRINKFYLKQTDEHVVIDDARVERFCNEVNEFTLASHLMWAVWSLVQAQSSQLQFNFVNYAQIRFDQYFKRKEEVINLR